MRKNVLAQTSTCGIREGIMLSSFPMEENAETLMSVDVTYTIVPSIQSLVFNNFHVHFKSVKHLVKGDF